MISQSYTVRHHFTYTAIYIDSYFGFNLKDYVLHYVLQHIFSTLYMMQQTSSTGEDQGASAHKSIKELVRMVVSKQKSDSDEQ